MRRGPIGTTTRWRRSSGPGMDGGSTTSTGSSSRSAGEAAHSVSSSRERATPGCLPTKERCRARASMLEETFEGAVVPEATPNPRTIRFITGELHRGPSRWYESAAQVDDPRGRSTVLRVRRRRERARRPRLRRGRHSPARSLGTTARTGIAHHRGRVPRGVGRRGSTRTWRAMWSSGRRSMCGERPHHRVEAPSIAHGASCAA